ncbi:MAG: tRNA(Met) cytidine acetyltransferase [Psychromonas sp.]|uniref:tRNA(Met) cytidine acetyltransferase TmcA n=1 Tax=Psychromonas sp. TaxID=1884585 RepID=UPI0039E6FB11
MPALLSLLNHLCYHAKIQNHRQLLRLQGDLNWCFTLTQKIISELQRPYFWCGHAPTANKTTPYQQILGQETSLLVINAHQAFDGNQFAAAEGSLRGGGLLILLSPTEIPPEDLFYHYISAQLQHYNFITLQQHLPLPRFPAPSPVVVKKPALNLSEQNNAVREIIKTVAGHRRRPLVLTANRGRGKSAALGIAAAQLLIASRVKKILVCAPNKQATATLFRHADLILKPAHSQSGTTTIDADALQFIAADALLDQYPACDLLIIDEAAALPVPTLEALVIHYSRLVFATTVHGYEGSGRGFALRFQKRLTELAPQWRKLHLDQPIRWAKNDPLEAFTLNSICLTESELQSPVYNTQQKLSFEKLTSVQLLADKALLQSLFSLLVLAHYQTKPSDLEKLLNDSSVDIFIARQQDKILGVTLIKEEGNFDDKLCEKIWQGTRRVPGNLIAQSLTFHSRFQQAASHSYARIQRIAIHPDCQNNGIGKQFIKYLIDWAKEQAFDHLCVSYGATANLLSFWQQQHFVTLRIGLSQDASSGTHSLIMNLPLSQKAHLLQELIVQQFEQQLPIQLSRHLQHLDTEVVLNLLLKLSLNNKKAQSEHPSLRSYTQGNLPYEFIEHDLIDLMLNYDLSALSKAQQCLAIQKILQNNSWAEICRKNNLTGKKQAQYNLKETIKQLTANG